MLYRVSSCAHLQIRLQAIGRLSKALNAAVRLKDPELIEVECEYLLKHTYLHSLPPSFLLCLPPPACVHGAVEHLTPSTATQPQPPPPEALLCPGQRSGGHQKVWPHEQACFEIASEAALRF